MPVWPCQLNYLPYVMFVVALATLFPALRHLLNTLSPFDVTVPCESHFGHVCVSASSLTLTVNVCKWQRYDRSRQSSGLTHTSTKKRHIPAVHWENNHIIVRELFKILKNTFPFFARPFKNVEPFCYLFKVLLKKNY